MSLNRPSGPIQSLSCNVCESCVCLCHRGKPASRGLETSGKPPLTSNETDVIHITLSSLHPRESLRPFLGYIYQIVCLSHYSINHCGCMLGGPCSLVLFAEPSSDVVVVLRHPSLVCRASLDALGHRPGNHDTNLHLQHDTKNIQTVIFFTIKNSIQIEIIIAIHTMIRIHEHQDTKKKLSKP